MPAPAWLGYVGAVTGIVGMITGIVALRRAATLKALDLRLQLRNLDADIDRELDGLPGLIESARRSRINVRSALGNLRTGDMDQWQTQVNIDQSAICALRDEFRSLTEDAYRKLSQVELENRLADRHRLQATVRQYSDKYRDGLNDDARQRDQLHADQRARPFERI